ncbi:MAG: phosphotransferase family protein [Sagittula sp.]|uniref:phosphotransferase family protein n=1 Tax=Sagittula sp. TaxID=2038081 RepID=UPI0040588575
MSASADMATALRAFVETSAPERGSVEITGLRPAPAGSSTENWFFDADWGDGPVPLVLRRAPRTEVVLVDRSAEYRILEALNDSGVPSPRAWWRGTFEGRPAMVLERCQGRAERMTLTPRNRMGLSETTRIALAGQITGILARLHRHPVTDRQEDPVETALAPYRAKAAALPDDAAAELRLGLWWLDDNRPEAVSGAIVHGDYRPANIMVEDGRVSAVLDWEFAHEGDPMEDLGWYLADVYRDQHFVTGHFGPKEFLATYEAQGGPAPDLRRIAWWSVFALQKLATIAVETLMAFRDGDDARMIQSPDRHLAALMRAVARDGRMEGVT